MQLLIVIAGLSQRVDRIRTGCGGKNNSEGATPLQGLAPFIFQQVAARSSVLEGGIAAGRSDVRN
jgi:hypothetical protein